MNKELKRKLMEHNNWEGILEGNENYSVQDLNKFVLTNIGEVSLYKDKTIALLMMYRNVLLKKMDTPVFTGGITIANLQKWFLEPISESQFNYIKRLMVKNDWTIQELWNVCKKESVSITTIIKCRNEKTA